MITRILHCIVAHPRVYDALQILVGSRYMHRHLGAQVAPLRGAGCVLDIGGGTGIHRDLWPETARYVCLDTDPVKLRGFLGAHPRDHALLGDATRAPLASGCVDAAICAAVSHHLPDDALPSLFAESARCLKAGGSLVFLDAVWERSRWPGRLLWRYDRGAYPRTKEKLRALIEERYEVVHWQEINIIHKYVLCVGAKPREERARDVG
jgi:SAM-dependent methyltransferase